MAAPVSFSCSCLIPFPLVHLRQLIPLALALCFPSFLEQTNFYDGIINFNVCLLVIKFSTAVVVSSLMCPANGSDDSVEVCKVIRYKKYFKIPIDFMDK